MHPSDALFQDQCPPVVLPVCDHYAGSEKLMRKSLALQHALGPIFDITFDCEDGASAGNEVAHAKLVGACIASPDNRFARVGVRVHDIHSPFFEQDVAAICALAAMRVAYFVIPKVNQVADVIHAIDFIHKHARQAGGDALPVHVLIETHGALADVRAIAALPHVACLSFGIMDFISAHYGAIPGDAMHTPAQFTHPLVARAKLEIAAACHAHGKVPSHNVTTDIQDPAIVAHDATRAAREFGYTRMWSIHPDQIKPIVQAFAPAQADIDDAAQILTTAQNNHWGPIQHHGKLHDRASYRYYWTVLQRAKSSDLPMPASAAAFFP